MEFLARVLYMRDPPETGDTVWLDVPTGYVACCQCPDHWTNHVGVAYKSGRLEVRDASGRAFESSAESCAVGVAGIHPSEAVGDAELAFGSNGELIMRRGYTVLGVGIRREGVPLSRYNDLSDTFGFPMTVCTNVWDAPELRLVTNVELPFGRVRVELEDAAGRFAVWCRNGGGWLRLAGGGEPAADIPISVWRAMIDGSGVNGELPVRITASAAGSARLVFRYWAMMDGAFVEDAARQRITAVDPLLLPDIDRDGDVDGDDAALLLAGRLFRFWTNEDVRKGDYVGQVADLTPNASDLVVNGRFDLVNLFPVKLDLGPFIDAWGGAATFRIRAGNDRLRFCGADVPPSAAGTIQTADVSARGGGNQPGAMLSAASLTPVTDAGVAIDSSDYLGIGSASGVLAFEAAREVQSYNSPELLVDVGGETLFRFRLPMAIDRVRNMYSWIGARHLSGEADYRGTVTHRIWDDDSLKSCVFLHGANVSGSDAQEWSDAVFKRLWLSGAKMEFYSVDWRSDIGSAANYHENASNAFEVAAALASTVAAIPGDKVMIAHSLGNMVVSSMIQDYGLQVSKYIMCNSAVPAEAYDATLSPTNVLVHEDWDEYPRKSFANEWYKCFEEDAGDDRQLLTWGGRFADVADYAVNFYSTGDHVLELYRNNNVWPTDGYENWSQMFERYSWHKQELWKGRAGILFNIGATDWAGWSIRENIVGYNTIQPTNAWLMSEAELRTNTVFKLQPESMNTNSIPLLLRGALLAKGIPARTPASGAMKWGTDFMNSQMFDLNSINVSQNGISRPNGWIVRPNGLFDDWGMRWLHSDIKDVAYFYVFKFFEKVKETGGLE